MIAETDSSSRKMRSNQITVDIDGLSPIHSEEAEKAVLGAMMSDPEHIIDMATEKLQADDFFYPAHKTLYDVLRSMRDEAIAIDPTTVLQYLEDRKMSESVGGAPMLGELSAGVLSVLTAPNHIETVRQKSILRTLQHACAKIVYNAQDRQHDVESVLDEAESLVFAITDKGVARTTNAARDVVKGTIDMILRSVEMKGQFDGLPTGFSELDQLTTGFKPGEMIVIAARPGVGKTALALSMAKNFLKERYDRDQQRFVKPGYPVGFFSLEMTCEQLMLRLLASYANVRLQAIREGKLTNQDLDALAIVAEEVAELPLYIDESSMLTINQLRAKARRMKQQHDIQVIIIDYLQLLGSSSDKARDNRQVEVAEVSRGLKALSKELGVPVIVLAQLNRRPDEGSGEPALHHLRESGSIEQDADVVMLLSRRNPSQEKDQDGPINWESIPATLNIAKQRNGPTDKLNLVFKASYTRYEDAPRDDAR